MFNNFMNDVSDNKFKSLSKDILSDDIMPNRLDEKSLNSLEDEKISSQKKESTVTKYPANYCGCFFDYDIDKLVIYVQDKSDIADISKYFDPAYVQYRKAKYSLNQL